MMKSIYEFKKNDVVVRVEPSSVIGYSIMNPDGTRDRSYIGEKLILMGVVNGCIYLQRTDELNIKIFKNKLVELPVDIFDGGWDYYIDPNKLLESVDDETLISTDGIQKALTKALAEENYEAAAKLKKLLNKNEKKKNK